MIAAVVAYLISLLICCAYIRYNDSDSEEGRKIIMGIAWIPLFNSGVALIIIVCSIIYLCTSDPLYKLIRYGRGRK